MFHCLILLKTQIGWAKGLYLERKHLYYECWRSFKLSSVITTWTTGRYSTNLRPRVFSLVLETKLRPTSHPGFLFSGNEAGLAPRVKAMMQWKLINQSYKKKEPRIVSTWPMYSDVFCVGLKPELIPRGLKPGPSEQQSAALQSQPLGWERTHYWLL